MTGSLFADFSRATVLDSAGTARDGLLEIGDDWSTPRCIRLRLSAEKKPSTALIEAEVGVRWNTPRRCRSSEAHHSLSKSGTTQLRRVLTLIRIGRASKLGRSNPVTNLRRLILLLPLLAQTPTQAQATDAFCLGLRQLVEAAANGFDYLPLGERRLPNSLNERRGITQSPDGPPRAAYYATMMSTPSRRQLSAAELHFSELNAEIGRCLLGAESGPMIRGQDGVRTSWTTPRAVVHLRREDGDGFASSAEVEVIVASRW
jgi:hypothetical protein